MSGAAAQSPSDAERAVRRSFIAVEGPIGVGKTTLMQRLADVHGLRTEREVVAENPYLADFYDDIPRWALQTEMFFLASRTAQIAALGGDAHGVVADFHLDKSLLFARRTLAPRELDKLRRILAILTEGLPVPDLTVILDADLATLRRRIRARGRGFEEAIEDRYLLDLRDDYRAFGEHLSERGSAVLHVDTTHLDLVHDDGDFSAIRARIEDAAREGHGQP